LTATDCTQQCTLALEEAAIELLSDMLGEPSIDPSIAQKLMRELQHSSDLPPSEEPLPECEVEVLKLLAQGLQNKEIAKELVMSERTVSTHVSNILSKLHLANRTQAALYALKEGLARLDP
jgi:NarL family two-component system response regulator LiaR